MAVRLNGVFNTYAVPLYIRQYIAGDIFFEPWHPVFVCVGLDGAGR